LADANTQARHNRSKLIRAAIIRATFSAAASPARLAIPARRRNDATAAAARRLSISAERDYPGSQQRA
jgi:hypothetical protein